MKKLNLFFATLVCSLVFSIGVKAQDRADFFAGKWDVFTLGTPSGDAHSLLVLERKEGKLVGTFKPEKGGEVKLTKVEEKDKSITAYFTTSGYDVYVYLEKKKDGTLTGSMMDMFDSTATRIVEEVKK